MRRLITIHLKSITMVLFIFWAEELGFSMFTSHWVNINYKQDYPRYNATYRKCITGSRVSRVISRCRSVLPESFFSWAGDQARTRWRFCAPKLYDLIWKSVTIIQSECHLRVSNWPKNGFVISDGLSSDAKSTIGSLVYTFLQPKVVCDLWKAGAGKITLP